MSFQVYTYQHPDFGPVMLLVDDQPQEEVVVREETPQNRPRGRSIKASHPLDKSRSKEKPIKSQERKKSIQNGVNLPFIPNKKTQFK